MRFSTPRLYWLVATVLVLAGLLTGAVAFGEVRGRSALITDITAVSGPISVDTQTLYRSLADADATAATAFLATDGESADLRARYLDDIAKASTALTVALRDADDLDAQRLRVVAEQLPVYTGLVETARSNQRLGVPLGGAYLREASGLMQQTILPAAARAFDRANGTLSQKHRDGSGFPWATALLVLLTGWALVTAQVMLARRSRRTVNLGLAGASVATVLALLWSGLALTVSGDRLETGDRDGVELVRLLANAGRASLQARTNESLTLVARGGGAEFEKQFTTQLDELIGSDGTGGLFDRAIAKAPWTDRAVIRRAQEAAVLWRDAHAAVRAADDGGDWNTAVELATGPGWSAPPAIFTRLDEALTEALDVANDRVERQAGQAGGALTGLSAGLVLLTAGLVAGVALGFRPRIGEYR